MRVGNPVKSKDNFKVCPLFEGNPPNEKSIGYILQCDGQTIGKFTTLEAAVAAMEEKVKDQDMDNDHDYGPEL